MFRQVNPNPKGSYVGDCVVRALCVATGKAWHDVYLDICLEGFMMCDMPSSNRVWGNYLQSLGYKAYAIPFVCNGCYSVRDFCGEHFKGKYVVGTGTHVLTIVDGDYYDSWDSGDEQPVYYWTREEIN